MKRSKLPQELAKNASKLHKHVGLLLTDMFPFYQVRQEYPVSKVNPEFKSNREKFDWVVLGLNIVIEVHGQQHYTPTCFGGITIEQAKRNFVKRKDVDWEKQQAAEKAGWAYIVVKYNEKKIVEEELFSKISEVEWKDAPEELISTKPKAKMQSRGFQKQEGKCKWPTRKIQNKKLK